METHAFLLQTSTSKSINEVVVWEALFSLLLVMAKEPSSRHSQECLFLRQSNPVSQLGSSLKISNGKKTPCRGCLPCGLEPCDSIQVDRESQTTESMTDINMRTGRQMSSAGPSKDGLWPLVWGTRLQESLRGFQTYRRHTLHCAPAEQDPPSNVLTKLNWRWISSGPRAHGPNEILFR